MIGVSVGQTNIFLFRKVNTWFSVKDGNWSDPNTWVSNGLDKKNTLCPQLGDNVVISHTVDYSNFLGISGYAFNTTIGNLFINANGTLTNTSGGNQDRLIVTGNLYCTGTIDFSTSVSVMFLELRGISNYIVNFNCGNTSTVVYSSNFSQNIVPVNYWNLEIANPNTKYIAADLTVTNQLIIDAGAVMDLGPYNSTIKNTQLQGLLIKTSSTGTVNFGTGGISFVNSTGGVNFSGVNPAVNLSGNLSRANGDMRSGTNFGNGTLNVLTNQSWDCSTVSNQPVSFGNVSIIIASGVTLTLPYVGTNFGGLLINGTSSINGVDGTSVLNVNGAFAYGNSSTIMATGVFNYNNSGTSTIIVYTGVTMSLPFTSFYALAISGGTVTLSGNTTVSNILSISGGNLQLSTYDFTVSGATTLAGGISKSGSGTVSFAAVSVQNSTGGIVFSSNPTVNLSGNISGDVRNGFNFGSGVVNITGNVTWSVWVAANAAPIINWNIEIASGKTLTNSGQSVSTGGINTTGTINGADATAIFDNRSVLVYNNATAPMATGKLYANQLANNYVIYGLAGNQDIIVPSDATPGYQNLTLQGSGAKKLLGNVSVKGVYTLTAPVTLNSNGFALTNP
jgi:hypothetical protein